MAIAGAVNCLFTHIAEIHLLDLEVFTIHLLDLEVFTSPHDVVNEKVHSNRRTLMYDGYCLFLFVRAKS